MIKGRKRSAADTEGRRRLRGKISFGCAALCAMMTFSFLGGWTCKVSGFSGIEPEYTEIAVDPTLNSEGYSAILYNNMNGLPTSEANAILQTEEGFIWIGCYSGLIRYDGNTFERMDSRTGVANVKCLYEDSLGRLWIGTNDGGAAVMENGEYTFFRMSDGLASDSVRAITEDPDGVIYIATTEGLTLIDQQMNLRNTDNPQIKGTYILEIRAGADGKIYGVTRAGEVFVMDGTRLTAFYADNRIGTGTIHAILPDPDNPGYVYLGTTESEIYYLRLGSTDIRVFDTSPVRDINSLEKIGDEIWYCADSGIGKINRNNVPVTLADVPMTTTVEQMITDYQGNMWFASARQGVMKIVPNQFTDVFDHNRIPSAVVNSTCYYDSKLFAGTDHGLVVVGEWGRIGSVPVEAAYSASGEDLHMDELLDILGSVKIRSIIKDSRDRLWFCCFDEENTIVRFDHGTVTVFNEADGLPSDRVRTVVERSDGMVMAACTGGLALIDEEDNISDIYNERDGISNTEILTVCEGPSGEMFVGTDGGGIYVIEGTSVTHIGTAEGLTSSIVMRIKKDPVRDILWVITGSSIAYIDADHNVTTVEQFPYSNNFDLYENSQGEMWILSSNGIYVTTADEMLANGEISTVYYGMANGLSCIATSNSYSGVSDEGDLYIAGTTGVCKVNIEVPFEDVNDLKLAVPFIEADGTYIYPDENGTFTVPSDTDRVTIYSYVYTYSLMDPQVTYRLEGFNGGETTVRRSELTPTDYTNLQGGEYRFVMSVKDAMGRGGNELSVLIVKQKSFYELTAVRLLALLAFLLLIALAVALYVRKKTEKLLAKQEKDRKLIREMVEAFAKIIDMKDKYTRGHSMRVAEYTRMLAEELKCDKETVESYYNIALLHDIGKIGIPPEVLNKDGKLTDSEFAMIKSHSALGYNVLKDITSLPDLALGAGQHHERPDGKGYPKGLTGDNKDFKEVAKIIAVADTFDAMYSDRPYRKRMNFDKVVSIIREVSGTQLDPRVVDAFLSLVDKGCFRAEDDVGGGTFEDIDNIHKKYGEKKD